MQRLMQRLMQRSRHSLAAVHINDALMPMASKELHSWMQVWCLGPCRSTVRPSPNREPNDASNGRACVSSARIAESASSDEVFEGLFDGVFVFDGMFDRASWCDELGPSRVDLCCILFVGASEGLPHGPPSCGGKLSAAFAAVPLAADGMFDGMFD